MERFALAVCIGLAGACARSADGPGGTAKADAGRDDSPTPLTAVPTNPPGDGDSARDASQDGPARPDAEPSQDQGDPASPAVPPETVPCPQADPRPGTACTGSGRCEYGSHPDTTCRSLYRCAAGAWVVERGDHNRPGHCEATLSACAAPAAQLHLQPCDPLGSACTTDETSCLCTTDIDSPVPLPPSWRCDQQLGGACSEGVPWLGQPCDREGAHCAIGCSVGGRLCQGGRWLELPPYVCPMSRRDVKTDVRNLSKHDRRDAAAAVHNLRLRRFRYKSHPNATPTLGFVIEDNPGFPAIDPGTQRVNLYTYTSLLVAAMQEQSEEIERLRARITRLELEARKGPATQARRERRSARMPRIE